MYTFTATNNWYPSTADDNIVIDYDAHGTLEVLQEDEGGHIHAKYHAMPTEVELYTADPEDDQHWLMHQDRYQSVHYPTGTRPTELQRNWVLGCAWYWLNCTQEGRKEIYNNIKPD